MGARQDIMVTIRWRTIRQSIQPKNSLAAPLNWTVLLETVEVIKYVLLQLLDFEIVVPLWPVTGCSPPQPRSHLGKCRLLLDRDFRNRTQLLGDTQLGSRLTVSKVYNGISSSLVIKLSLAPDSFCSSFKSNWTIWSCSHPRSYFHGCSACCWWIIQRLATDTDT